MYEAVLSHFRAAVLTIYLYSSMLLSAKRLALQNWRIFLTIIDRYDTESPEIKKKFKILTKHRYVYFFPRKAIYRFLLLKGSLCRYTVFEHICHSLLNSDVFNSNSKENSFAGGSRGVKKQICGFTEK